MFDIWMITRGNERMALSAFVRALLQCILLQHTDIIRVSSRLSLFFDVDVSHLKSAVSDQIKDDIDISEGNRLLKGNVSTSKPSLNIDHHTRPKGTSCCFGYSYSTFYFRAGDIERTPTLNGLWYRLHK